MTQSLPTIISKFEKKMPNSFVKKSLKRKVKWLGSFDVDDAWHGRMTGHGLFDFSNVNLNKLCRSRYIKIF